VEDDVIGGQGKLVCTGKGTHKRRRLGEYITHESGFIITVHIDRDVRTMQWDPRLDAGTEEAFDDTIRAAMPAPYGQTPPPQRRTFRFLCRTCQPGRDLRFSGENLWRYLTADLPTGSTYRDLSLLAAIL
jgi:hypothetical protein